MLEIIIYLSTCNFANFVKKINGEGGRVKINNLLLEKFQCKPIADISSGVRINNNNSCNTVCTKKGFIDAVCQYKLNR